jgi:hypothetical protein
VSPTLPEDSSNQRWSPRVPYASQLLVVHDREAWSAELQDISEGGCGIFRPEACDLEVGLLVRLYFYDGPGYAVGVDARVARDDPRSLGFEYHEPQTIPPSPR